MKKKVTDEKNIANSRSRARDASTGALGHFLVSIFFRQVDNKESKNKYRSITLWLYYKFFLFGF